MTRCVRDMIRVFPHLQDIWASVSLRTRILLEKIRLALHDLHRNWSYEIVPVCYTQFCLDTKTSDLILVSVCSTQLSFAVSVGTHEGTLTG